MSAFKIPSRLLLRETYLDKIQPFMNKSLVKVLMGQRRVGKSFLLYQLIQLVQKEDKQANIIYINKEDFTFDDIRNAADLHEYVTAHTDRKKKNYIFIDEIQEIIEFEKAVRSLLLDENNDIYITGSNARLLSGELATLLGGRTVEFRVNSLSYREFLSFHELDDSDNSLDAYMKYGGLPYLVNLELRDHIVYEYLKNIYTTIVYRDVVARYNVRNTHFLEKLILFLADNTGCVFSSKSISDFLKSQKVNIAHNQVQTYIGHLANAFLIDEVARFDLKGKRIFEVGEKYYFENPGIRNAIAGYRPGDQGKLVENLIYNQLKSWNYEIHIGQLDTREIDFVATKENETLYIQAALRLDSEKTIEREFGNLQKIRDDYPKMVITMDKTFKNTWQGITHLSLRDFLMMSPDVRKR